MVIVRGLAQSGGSSGANAGSALAWAVAMIAFVVIGAVVVMVLRRSCVGKDSRGSADPFSLHELRRLRDTGAVSEEEFQRARAAMLGRHSTASVSVDNRDADDRRGRGDPPDEVARPSK